MAQIGNIFAQGMDAYDHAYSTQKAIGQDRAKIQAGQAIAGGDYTGGANLFNQAGMVEEGHNVLADQLALKDRQTADANLVEDRATKAKAQSLEMFGKGIDAIGAVSEGQRLPYIQQHADDLKLLGIPVERFQGKTEADLSDAALAPLKGAIHQARLTFQKVGNDVLGVDEQGNVKKTFRGPIVMKKDEAQFAPDNPGYGDPAAPPAPGTAPQASAPGSAPQASSPQVAPANFSPRDRDALARMMATEAGGEGPNGMAAVAHVALNRLNSRYGGASSLADVVNAPNQFEGMSRAGQVHSQDLQRAGMIADQVISGNMPDPTNGAVQFLNPDLQAKLGRAQPAWATGNGQRIGNHVFYGGGKKDGAAQAIASIDGQGSDTLAGGQGHDVIAPTGYHLIGSGPHDPEDAPLTKEAVTMGATQIAMTGKVPALGMGKAARNDRKAMLDEAAQLINKWDISPEDWVTGVAQFKISQGSLSKISQTKNMVQAAENAVIANMNKVVMPLMTKVDPGGIPFLNKYTMAIRDRAFGNPDVKAYDNALHTVADEYSKVMTTTTGSGGTATSDSARQEAYRRLSTSQTGPQLKATFAALQSEMANRRQALEQQEVALTGQLRNGLAPPGATGAPGGYQPTPPPAAPAPATPPAKRPPLASFNRH